MKDDWRSKAELYEKQRMEMTPAEKKYEREHGFSGDDWFKLFLILAGIYFLLNIISAFK